jgi:hypothetical protein
MIVEHIGDIAVLHGDIAPLDDARVIRYRAIQGEFRCPAFELLRCPSHLGLRALHIQQGKKILVDVGEVYFNVRHDGLRRLLSAHVHSTRITVLGEGVGIISLLLYRRGRVILGIESNPRAHRLALLNRELNDARGYTPLLGWFPSQEFHVVGLLIFAMPRLFFKSMFCFKAGACIAFCFCRVQRITFLLKVLTGLFGSEIVLLGQRETSPSMRLLLIDIASLSWPSAIKHEATNQVNK